MTKKIVIVILFLIAALVLIGFLQKGYPVTITEEELNTHLTKAFVYPDSPGYNPRLRQTHPLRGQGGS